MLAPFAFLLISGAARRRRKPALSVVEENLHFTFQVINWDSTDLKI